MNAGGLLSTCAIVNMNTTISATPLIGPISAKALIGPLPQDYTGIKPCPWQSNKYGTGTFSSVQGVANSD